MRPPYRLLAIGRFVRKKGFDQLLRAAKLLADAGVDFRLTIAGDGMLRLPLKWQAARLHIADRVHFPASSRTMRWRNCFSKATFLSCPA